ncbi:hypothetical protein RYJ27_10115 [Microbacterium limosum]|uniref:Uncharacterized protein n=1 Tax=Microbacterium limosum TaxID=3079935 RepID=A0AAU0MF30_9MICO|nr:hypothetical protein [Microbacterium sp. Y20]WOQ69053.1 hypothetical protein RYJ27_10115 [Microbacterium sp. Y20]
MENDYTGWAAGIGIVGFLTAIVLYLGMLALTLWVFYLIIRTAVKNGILKADEERRRRSYPLQ